MKRFLPILFTAVLALSTHASFAQASASDALTEAQRAYIRGDTDTAKERFQYVLQLDPNNKTVQNYLRMINSMNNQNQGSELEKQLKGLILPQVELKDATFDTALEYLKQTAAKVSGGKVNASFVVQVPEEEAATKKVTLSLKNIPFTEVLHYLSDLTTYKFTIEKYAISVRPGASATSVSTNNVTTPPAPDTTTK